MKVCTSCNKKKKLIDFHRNKNNKDGRTFQCKDCSCSRATEWRNSGSPKERKKKQDNQRMSCFLNKKRNRNFVLNYLKEHPCLDCGEKDPIVLEFDHVRGNKTANVSVMMNGKFSIDNLSMEIAKCDVRCANCHRRRTALNQGWYKDL